MNAQKFDIEHWPSYFGKHTLKRLAIGYVKGIVLMLALAAVFYTLYYFTRLNFLYRFSGAFLLVILLSPLLPIISYFQRNKKVPSYGINKDGFLLNERGWNAAFFTWDEIKEIHDFNDPNFGPELHFDFVSYTKAINKPGQEKFIQSLSREYEIAKKPKKISNELVKGDTANFIQAFKNYYGNHERREQIPNSESKEQLDNKFIQN